MENLEFLKIAFKNFFSHVLNVPLQIDFPHLYSSCPFGGVWYCLQNQFC